ncbi:hypothetical protein [Pyxidicoccus caerfyrddinensis]|uniref:hypothetical protein n=1 Tax=Pyxidicoccus caerfyrddinensis TaxID=2709663 RepID=UPI0013DB2B98|nr:hypothetical protein [Pyxidicoccus caerfyrddinensis]
MAARIQWVNLPSQDTEAVKRSRFLGHGVESEEHMGREVYIDAGFDSPGVEATLVIVPEGDNAPSPMLRAEVLTGEPGVERTGIDAKRDGKVHFKVALSSAGGDRFSFKIKSNSGEEKDLPEVVETRRILFYQMIHLDHVTVSPRQLTAHLEDEFQNEGEKHFIKLVGIPPAREMVQGPGIIEKAEWNSTIVRLAGEAYSRAKDPFCFAAILVDQLAEKLTEDYDSKAEIDEMAAEFDVYAMNPLWDVGTTPAEHALNRWFLEGKFVEEDGDGRTFVIDRSRLKPRDPDPEGRAFAFTVDLSHLPQGAKGRVSFKYLVTDFTNGVSFPWCNLICVATRTHWKDRASDEIRSTLVHEAGHKVGMVPAGQTTYYVKNGRHCNHHGNKCVMFDAYHKGRSNRFCEVCTRSLRGLDLGGENPGLKPFS